MCCYLNVQFQDQRVNHALSHSVKLRNEIVHVTAHKICSHIYFLKSLFLIIFLVHLSLKMWVNWICFLSARLPLIILKLYICFHVKLSWIYNTGHVLPTKVYVCFFYNVVNFISVYFTKISIWRIIWDLNACIKDMQ